MSRPFFGSFERNYELAVLIFLCYNRVILSQEMHYADILNDKDLFRLDAGEMNLAFSITDGILMTRHYGARLERFGDIPERRIICERRRVGNFTPPQTHDEFPGWNSLTRGTEPALKVNFADGTRNLRLRYVSHSINGNELDVILSDPLGVEVKLIYRVYDDCGVIRRQAVITNSGKQDIELESFNSAVLHLPFATTIA